MKLLIVTQKVDKNDQLLGFFIEWLRRLAGKFEKLTVLCLEKGRYDLPGNVEVISLGKDQDNFQFFPMAKPSRILDKVGTIFKKVKYLFRFYKYIWQKSDDYDSVFVHMNPVWMVLGGLYWKILDKKRIFWYTHKSVTLKLRLAKKLSDVIFTASKESFRLPSKKIVITGHGIDTELFKPVRNVRSDGSDGFVGSVRGVGNEQFEQVKRSNMSIKLLSVGRISPVKNYETLIEAAKILKDKGTAFSVTMVGEAPLKEDKNYELRIKNKIKELGLAENFNFVGKISHNDLPGYYQSHDIFVHLSKTGSLDKAILEAMASGMKVLSSNDASRGFLPPELIFNQDDSKELADKIKLLSGQNPDDKLREYVVKNHDLSDLVGKIYEKTVNDTVVIYPFPYSSRSNKYISLLYSNINGKVVNGVNFSVKDPQNSFLRLFLSVPSRGSVIHIHWTNVIYGSKFVLKMILLMIFNLSILGLLKARGCRVVWTMHNYYPHDSGHIWLNKIGQKTLFALSDAVTLHQQNEQIRLASKHKNKKIVFIPHGNYIDAYGPLSGARKEMRRKFNFEENDIIALSVGAVKPYKKIENIITAFNAISGGSPVKLLVIGKCDERYAGRLKALAGGDGRIKIICDFIPDKEMPDYLAMADHSVFWYDDSVLTSGGIILSLSYGVSVVARNIPAADLAENGKNGFLFNNKQELTDILTNLPNMPKFERDKVIATVEHLDWNRISGEFIKLYYSLWKS